MRNPPPILVNRQIDRQTDRIENITFPQTTFAGCTEVYVHDMVVMVFFCSGYGGGFMERDVNPEYIKHDDSEDEYDEVSGI